ncbi:MAG: Holliday junction resolvase RuvX [Brevinematales bacterium]|nr:Holliday junction resolvase RuvX [Brevinematales bacterium]
MGRILAIDVGTKKIGLALTDPLRLIASPWGSLHRDTSLWSSLKSLCERESVDLIVVGYVALDYYGEATAMVKNFVAELKKVVDIPIEFQDESHSSQEAERYLRSRGRKKSSREDRDSLAATCILWEYLERQKGT